MILNIVFNIIFSWKKQLKHMYRFVVQKSKISPSLLPPFPNIAKYLIAVYYMCNSKPFLCYLCWMLVSGSQAAGGGYCPCMVRRR